jgi:hypothetical protein
MGKKKSKYNNEKWLREQYIGKGKGKTAQQIANEILMPVDSIRHWLSYYGIRKTIKNDTNTYIKKKWLNEQLNLKKKQPALIAKECGVCVSTINKYICTFNLKKKVLYTNKIWLEDQFVIQGRTPEQIATECDVQPQIIIKWLRSTGIIPKFTLTYLDKEWLTQKYVKEDLDSTQIGVLCEVSRKCIKRSLVKFKIEKKKKLNYKYFPKYKSKNWLIKQMKSGKTQIDIAKAGSCTTATIREYQKRYKLT